jgi:hypothetical protein
MPWSGQGGASARSVPTTSSSGMGCPAPTSAPSPAPSGRTGTMTESLSHQIYKNINRAIIYAPGSSHAYIQQIIKISQHMSRIKAYKL